MRIYKYKHIGCIQILLIQVLAYLHALVPSENQAQRRLSACCSTLFLKCLVGERRLNNLNLLLDERVNTPDVERPISSFPLMRHPLPVSATTIKVTVNIQPSHIGDSTREDGEKEETSTYSMTVPYEISKNVSRILLATPALHFLQCLRFLHVFLFQWLLFEYKVMLLWT